MKNVPASRSMGHRQAAILARGVGNGVPSHTEGFTFDPNAPAFDIDPFPIYRYMREHLPVYWWPEARGWVVTRYHDVAMLLRDPRFSVEVKDWESAPPEQPDDQLTTHQLLAKYGLFWLPAADHRRVRQILAPLFTPSAVAGSVANFA